jgi:hypothetical protein
MAVLLAASVLACSRNLATDAVSDPLPDLDGGVTRAWQSSAAITQRVRLLNAQLRTGDTLKIESVLKNISNQTIDVNRVVCELDVESGLNLESPFILCAAYSVKGPLAPGEEAVGYLQRVVRAKPGRYQIVIRHLLEPSTWVPAGLTVYP